MAIKVRAAREVHKPRSAQVFLTSPCSVTVMIGEHRGVARLRLDCLVKYTTDLWLVNLKLTPYLLYPPADAEDKTCIRR